MSSMVHAARRLAKEVVEHWPLFPHVALAMAAIWGTCHMPGTLQIMSTPLVVLCTVCYLYLVDGQQRKYQEARLERSWLEHRQRLQQIRQTGGGGSGPVPGFGSGSGSGFGSNSGSGSGFGSNSGSGSGSGPGSSSVEDWINGLVSACWPAWETGLVSPILETKIREILDPICGNKISLERVRLGASPPLMHSCKLRYPSMLSSPPLSSSSSSSSGPRSTEDRDAVQLDMDLSYVAGDNMGVVFTVPMGYFATKLFCDHLTIKCKLRLGLKFVAYSPYVSALSVCFLSMPNLNLSIRPMSSSGLALTDLPIIANWVSNSIHLAIQHCGLIYPDKMDIDFIQLWGTDYGLNLDPIKEDSKGFSDPYVTITRVGESEKQPGYLKLKTKVKKQTLNPSWRESFTIPITTSLSSAHKLLLRCRDRDVFVDDELGFAELDLSLYRDGKRHEITFKLREADHGELLVAVTVVGAACVNKPNPNPHPNDQALLQKLQEMISKTGANPGSSNDQDLVKQLQDMLSHTNPNPNPSHDQGRSGSSPGPVPRRSITSTGLEARAAAAAAANMKRRRSTLRTNTLPMGVGGGTGGYMSGTGANSPYGTARRASTTTYARRPSVSSVPPPPSVVVNYPTRAPRRSSINASSGMTMAARAASPPFSAVSESSGPSAHHHEEEQEPHKSKHKHLFPFGSYFKHKSKTKDTQPKS